MRWLFVHCSHLKLDLVCRFAWRVKNWRSLNQRNPGSKDKNKQLTQSLLCKVRSGNRTQERNCYGREEQSPLCYMYLFSLYLTFILCSLLFVSHFFLFPLTQQNTFWSKTFKMSLQEFLKKEFSDENIVFWIACENFRNISDFEEVCKKVILRNSNKGHNYSYWETLFERLL